MCFFLTMPAPTETYTLSLHDALPISNAALARLADAVVVQIDEHGAADRAAQLTKGVIGCGGAGCKNNGGDHVRDRKSTRLNSSHSQISYAVFCLKKKTTHKSKAGKNP